MNQYLGEIKIFSTSNIPDGWAECNGQLLSVVENQQLYSILWNTYGGTRDSTFALPDLRGRAAISTDNAQYLPGNMGGTESVTLNIEEMGSHTHNAHAVEAEGRRLLLHPNVSSLAEPSSRNKHANIKAYTPYSSSEEAQALNKKSISNTGGGQAHNNMMPYIALTYCIAVKGLYPTYD